MSLSDSFPVDDFALWLSFDRHSQLSRLHSAPGATASQRRNATRSSVLPNSSNLAFPVALNSIQALETAPTPVIALSNISTVETLPSAHKSPEMHHIASQAVEVDKNDRLRSMPRAIIADDKSLRAADASATDVVPPETSAHPSASRAINSEELAAKKLSAAAIALLMTPLCLSVLLSALDLTIITPAIPTIVSHFHSTSGYVWIGSAFILSSTVSTPIWGSLADIWGRKPILLISLTIFLGGSLLCAVAPSMHSLIAGRVIQGLGSAGMGIMVNIIICDTFSLRDRGLYLAITSLAWAIGSAIGPVIGGSFTTKLSWRWCFWINLPIGAVVLIVLTLFLELPSPHTPVLVGLKAIDWVGCVLIMGAALMILLGLDFGDISFPWSSPTVICLIIFGIVTFGIFIVNEWKFTKNPVIPLRLFAHRSTVAAYLVWSYNFYILVGLSYYLPLYSQSVLGVNALVSGVHLVPLIVACSLSAACAGAYIQKTGTYLPITYVAHIFLCLGCGLLINLKIGESLTKLIIFEIITGVGIGMNIEPPLIAVQAAMTVMDTAVIQATITFVRSLATTVAIVVGGVIFQNRMNAASHKLVDEVGEEVARMFNGDEASASVELIRTLPPAQQQFVKDAYFRSLRSVWIMFVIAAGLSFVANFFLRAHHLSNKADGAVLGVDRGKKVEHQPNPSSTQMMQTIELRTLSDSTARVRPSQHGDTI
ncbi:putative MFS transporter [Paraphoma chrysanthemicola]|uniref:MFS transporter n=1 Tax=Paraphoma chrysanthemicola TaxID=798071 RepID=A0A8K0R771_9PLEO|nr:putative MFS transporter [Paraphoma chrysanthemicola]